MRTITIQLPDDIDEAAYAAYAHAVSALLDTWDFAGDSYVEVDDKVDLDLLRSAALDCYDWSTNAKRSKRTMRMAALKEARP
jgi:hypothetical protein